MRDIRDGVPRSRPLQACHQVQSRYECTTVSPNRLCIALPGCQLGDRGRRCVRVLALVLIS